MKRLILLRHGESHWNAEGRIQGQHCAGLSERGHAQARAAADELARRLDGEVRLVTSDLMRAVQTTEPITDALGVAPTVDVRLRERSFGRWEQRLRDEVASDDADTWSRWCGGEDVIAEIGGESGQQLVARVSPVLRELLEDSPDDGVTVAVTHGGPIWHGTHALLDLDRPTLGGIANVAITQFGSIDAAVWLDRWNETAYLPVELRGAGPPQRAPATVAPPVGH